MSSISVLILLSSINYLLTDNCWKKPLIIFYNNNNITRQLTDDVIKKIKGNNNVLWNKTLRQ